MNTITLLFIGSDFKRREMVIAPDGSSVSLEWVNACPGPDEEVIENRQHEPISQKELDLGRAVYTAIDKYFQA